MSTSARLTLLGMYNYDNTLFDSVSLPEGYDKETFINAMLLEHGEKCVLYTDPNFLKFSFGAISQKWYMELSRIYEALSAEYDPISNYDRHESITDTNIGGHTEKTTAKYDADRTANLEDKRTANLEDKRTLNSNDTTEQLEAGERENKVSAFNSSSYEPKDKTIEDMGKIKVDHGGTDTMNTTGTDTTNHTGTDKYHTEGTLSDVTGSNNNTLTHTAHIYGNIGVTTATQMTNEILAQRTKHNLYLVATNIFANELLIQVY